MDDRIRGYYRGRASPRSKKSDISFNTKDDVARLPVVTNLAATNESLRSCCPLEAATVPAFSVGRQFVSRGCIAPGATYMRADIETSPVVDGKFEVLRMMASPLMSCGSALSQPCERSVGDPRRCTSPF
jgi:hypothetical protein